MNMNPLNYLKIYNEYYIIYTIIVYFFLLLVAANKIDIILSLELNVIKFFGLIFLCDFCHNFFVFLDKTLTLFQKFIYFGYKMMITSFGIFILYCCQLQGIFFTDLPFFDLFQHVSRGYVCHNQKEILDTLVFIQSYGNITDICSLDLETQFLHVDNVKLNLIMTK
jgi:hypothetical protein